MCQPGSRLTIFWISQQFSCPKVKLANIKRGQFCVVGPFYAQFGIFGLWSNEKHLFRRCTFFYHCRMRMRPPDLLHIRAENRSGKQVRLFQQDFSVWESQRGIATDSLTFGDKMLNCSGCIKVLRCEWIGREFDSDGKKRKITWKRKWFHNFVNRGQRSEKKWKKWIEKADSLAEADFISG